MMTKNRLESSPLKVNLFQFVEQFIFCGKIIDGYNMFLRFNLRNVFWYGILPQVFVCTCETYTIVNLKYLVMRQVGKAHLDSVSFTNLCDHLTS